MTTIEALRAARARIDTPEKWWKFEWPFNPGLASLDMAIEQVCNDSGQFLFGPLTKKVRTSLIAQLPDRFSSLILFNDHPSTTHADVLALFDRAIAQEEDKS